MDQREYILSTEELSFALALCQYDNLAYSILFESIGEVSEEGLELIYQTASRSLFTKGILLNMNEDKPEEAFINGFSELLEDLSTSNHMFRAFNENENGSFVLTAHSSRNGVIFHIVSNQIVHILKEMDLAELKEEVSGFFQVQFNTWDSYQFSMPEKEFQEFIQAIQENKTIQPSVGSEQFVKDFHEVEGKIVNMSLLRTENDGLPEFLDVVLLLIGKERVWTITEENLGEEKKIIIKTVHSIEWEQLLDRLLTGIESSKQAL